MQKKENSVVIVVVFDFKNTTNHQGPVRDL